MKIEKLSECSFKIILSKADMSDCGIRYDSWNSDKAAGFLLSVSDEIKAKTGADITHEKLYVEIFSCESGCTIFISYPRKGGVRKSGKCRIACMFKEYKALRACCRKLNEEFQNIIKSSSLYYNEKFLYLEIEIPRIYKERVADLQPYGYFSECSEISHAFAIEYYTCAEAENAVEKIIS